MKILFFIENNWVFGKIHNELIKVLYPEVYCDILDYTKSYDRETIHRLAEKYDYFLSNTWGCANLYTQGVPANKLIGIAHGEIDLFYITGNRTKDLEFISNMAGFGVISPYLYNISLNSDIQRVPHILRIGLNTELYRSSRKYPIDTVGYLGIYERIENGRDIKRGRLINDLITKSGLNLLHRTDRHFLEIEKMYKEMDLMVFASLSEGNPYTALEAFAAGIPVLGTPTGLFPELAASGGGFLLPFDEKDFIECGLEIIHKLKNDPDFYVSTCNNAIGFSQTFDWRVLREHWIDYLYSL